MKLVKLALTCLFMVSVANISLSANAVKGQKLFVKKLKKSCGINGAKFAAMHSQDEWEKIMEDGNFKNELKIICPKVDENKIKDKWIQHFYDFSYEYANDSGNVPSC